MAKSEKIPEAARRSIDAVGKVFTAVGTEAEQIKREGEAAGAALARVIADPKGQAEADGKARADFLSRVRNGGTE